MLISNQPSKMDRLRESRRLHYPYNHPSRDSVVSVDGDKISDIEPIVGGGNTTSAFFWNRVVEQTFLRI